MGAELFHAGRWTDGRTGMTKLIAAFRNFANEPQNVNRVSQYFRPQKHALKYYFNACYTIPVPAVAARSKA
jgi:hypothetical protein